MRQDIRAHAWRNSIAKKWRAPEAWHCHGIECVISVIYRLYLSAPPWNGMPIKILRFVWLRLYSILHFWYVSVGQYAINLLCLITSIFPPFRARSMCIRELKRMSFILKVMVQCAIVVSRCARTCGAFELYVTYTRYYLLHSICYHEGRVFE